MIAIKFDKCHNKVIYEEFKKFSVMRWLIFWVNLKDKQYLSSKGEAGKLWIDAFKPVVEHGRYSEDFDMEETQNWEEDKAKSKHCRIHKGNPLDIFPLDYLNL